MNIEDFEIKDNNNITITYYDEKESFFDIIIPLDVVKTWTRIFHEHLYEECYQVDHAEVELDYKADKFFSFDTFEKTCDNEDLKGVIKYAKKHCKDEITIKELD